MTRRKKTVGESAAGKSITGDSNLADDLLQQTIVAVMNRPDDAGPLARRIAELAEHSGDRRTAAVALLTQAWADLPFSRYSEALAAADLAIAAFGALGDLAGEAHAVNMGARIRTWLGLPERSVEEFGRALALSIAAGDSGQQCDALVGSAIALQMLGRLPEALESFDKATSIAIAIDDPWRIADCRIGRGNIFQLIGRSSEAIEQYHLAIEAAARDGNLRFESHASGNIGSVLERMGDLSAALEYHHRALQCSEMLDDRPSLGATHNNIGIIHQRLGAFAPALEHLLKSLAISIEIGDRHGEMVTLGNIGSLYEVVGAHGQVLEYYQRSRALAEQIGHRSGEANALLLTGRYHLHMGDRQQALLHLFRSLRMHEQTGDTHGRIAALVAIGTALHRIGDFARAAVFLQDASEQAVIADAKIADLSARLELALLATTDGNTRKAIGMLESVIEQARDIDAREALRRAHEGLAVAQRAVGDISGAAINELAARELLRSMFDAEASHRLREMMTAFEQSTVQQHAAEMGIASDDLEQITAALAHSSPGTPLVPSPPAARTITVTTFGELGVVIDGREVTQADWKRKRSRDLFKLLLLHYRRPLSLDTIVERLGGSIGDRGSELVIMNAVSHIRRALEPERPPRERTTYLRHTDNGYLLDLGEAAEIDFLRFKELVAAARRAGDAEARRHYYEQAGALYRDDFLKEDYDAPWTDTERSILRDAWLEALEYVAAEQLRTERFDEAIATARAILGHDNLSTRAHEVLLEGLARRGRRGFATA